MKTRKTSIDCFNQIKEEGLLSNMRFKIYESILINAPCTSAEVLSTMLSKNSAITSSRARFTELRELGVIYEVQNRKCTITGRTSIEWDLTDRLPVNMKKTNKTKKHRTDDALNSLRELYKNKNNSTVEDWKEVANLIKII
jgi:hypothetical protein